MLNRLPRDHLIIGVPNVGDEGIIIMNLGIPTQAGQIKEYAVIPEPSGGVPQPNGEMYLIGDS